MSMADQLSRFRIFVMLIAGVHDDIGHENVTKVPRLPLASLFRRQSGIEARHCSLTIRLLSGQNWRVGHCIWHVLEVPDRKLMWNQVIELILSIDMTKHFKHVIDLVQLI
jgi:hypothetical protein